MSGTKIVLIMLLAAILIGVISFSLYLLTRPNDESSGRVEPSPNALIEVLKPGFPSDVKF